MAEGPEIDQLAAALRLSIGLLRRRLRQIKATGELTMPEISALARLEAQGPITAAALAKIEQISPQSIGATLAALEQRGLVRREADPGDGRRILMSASDAGLDALRDRRNATVALLAAALRSGFTQEEIELLRSLAPLLERLAQTI